MKPMVICDSTCGEAQILVIALRCSAGLLEVSSKLSSYMPRIGQKVPQSSVLLRDI